MRIIISSLIALSSVTAASLNAHPGHDHADITSLVRHPFADVGHLAATIAVATLLVSGAVLVSLLRRAKTTQPTSSP